MTIQTLSNGVPLLEQRTKLNANFSELDQRTAAAQGAADAAANVAGNAATAAGNAAGAASAAAADAAAKYTRPADGIPAADLDSAVQASLGKAESALQSVTAASVGLANVANLSPAGLAAPGNAVGDTLAALVAANQVPPPGDGLPVYLFGDSLFARSTYENTFTAATFVYTGSAGGYIVPLPVPLAPSGTVCRVYGFADPRYNFTSAVTFVGGQCRIPLPSSIDYTGQPTDIASLPAAAGQARAHNCLLLTDQSPIAFANNAGRKRYAMINLAQGGITSTAMAALLEGYFTGLPPGIVVLEGGVNTSKNGESRATVVANYTAMLTWLQSRGHKVILTTNTTFSSAFAGYAAINLALMSQAQALRDLARQFNVRCLDLNQLWVDGNSADAQPKAGYATSDGVHWRTPFQVVLAAALVPLLDALDARFSALPVLASPYDAKLTQAGAVQQADHPNILRNGQMFGTAGTAGLPDGWTHALAGAPTVVYTKAVSPLGASDGTLVIDYTGNAGSNVSILSTSFHSEATPGKTITLSCEVEFPANTTGLRFGATVNLDSSGGTGEVGKQVGMVSYEQGEWRAGTYRLMSLDWVVPAGVSFTGAKVMFQVVAVTAQTNTLVRVRQLRVDVR